MQVLTGIGRLFTATTAGTIAGAVVAFEGDRVVYAGSDQGFHVPDGAEVVDVGGALVTPGLIDAHTHPVYAGDRLAEVADRSAGASYAALAEAGGGIGATVRATRAEPPERLEALVRDRLAAWPRHGTTTVEVKTGYHLDRAGELADVALLAALAGRPGGADGAGGAVGSSPLPRLDVTFLGAHALPPGGTATTASFAREVASWTADAAAAGARSCDVFCDEGYFSIDESRTVLAAGAAAGLRARVHADELARTGGARLAAELRAASADHLLRIDAGDATALAAASVTAVLCPVTALSMGAPPPARALLDAGVTLALGTDHNPGTSGLVDMSVVIALAVAALGLSVDEALTAATAGGARSLGHPDRGAIAPGALADLVVWDADHEGAFAWAWGVSPRRVWIGGEVVR